MPGGLLIVKDFLTDNDRSGQAYNLMFALNMLVGTEGGDTYSQAQVAGWTTKAGFPPGQPLDLTPRNRLWLAREP